MRKAADGMPARLGAAARWVCIAGLSLACVLWLSYWLFTWLQPSSQAAKPTLPWWHVSTIDRPTNLWLAATEMQEVQEGALTVLEVEGKFVACIGSFGSGTCESLLGHKYTASATELQEELEAVYGAGVTVTRPSAETYVVSTPGRFVPGLEVGNIGEKFQPFSGSVRVSGGSGRLVVVVTNIGDAATRGAVKVTDSLPAGLVALHAEAPVGATAFLGDAPCRIESGGAVVECTFTGEPRPLPSFESIEMEVEAAVVSGAPSEEVVNGEVTVTGGGAEPVNVDQTARLSPKPTRFGIESYSFTPEAEGGAAQTQAGSHPFQVTSEVDLNQGPVSGVSHRETLEQQPALPRNFSFRLPAGLVGNANAVPQCSEAQFVVIHDLLNECPASSAVGVATTTIIEHEVLGLTTLAVPVFNLTPAPGEPARFGFTAGGVPVVLNTSVRSGEGYGVTVSVRNTSESASLLDSLVTLWGVPGDSSHDSARGYGCVYFSQPGGCARPEGLEANAFLRLPTSCGSEEAAPMNVESWPVIEGGAPSRVESEAAEADFGPLDGCNRVPFEPQLEVAPSSSAAASPVGVTVRLKVPQAASAPAEGIAEADVRNTTVTLPAGLQLNPSVAAGLRACSEEEIGYLRNTPAGELVFSEESEAEKSGEAPHGTGCPEGSQVGTAQVTTPLLKEPLTGAVYQAAQDANPFGSLLALYVVAEAPRAGVRVRLAGEVKVAPDGQLTSRFPQTPQVPFEDFTLKFIEGGEAPLATTGCGVYATTSEIEPWSSTSAEPVIANPVTTPFEVTSGPGGSPCSSLGRFSPSFVAGTTSNDAGSFSPFVLSLSRKDGEQTLSTIATRMPRGLIGMISNVTPCPEAQANAGDCPASSKIGHVVVQAGVGDEPLTLPERGKPADPVYLTGPYKGAPFGIAIVAPAEAGPFDLGTVIVRGRVSIDPRTAEVSIESDPMPTRLQGVPLDVRAAEVVIDKSKFIVNPTSCDPTSVTGAIGSSEGGRENVSTRFQAANCLKLPFEPSLGAFTRARHSNRFGAFLQVVVRSGIGQANIGRVHVRLPKALPSRQATLKLACSEAQFARNPAGCPAGSFVGTASAVTPVLPVPLTGPVIFVSHGGAGFPNLDVVLQGDHVTLELIGDTSIRKGATSSTFASLPDAPVSRFTLTLPEGPHSALAANGNLCKERPRMPTTIVGQNGAAIERNTKIKVLGCKAGRTRGRRHMRHRRG